MTSVNPFYGLQVSNQVWQNIDYLNEKQLKVLTGKFRDYCEKECGFSKTLAHPHVLRHTRAMEMVRAGVPLTRPIIAGTSTSGPMTALRHRS